MCRLRTTRLDVVADIGEGGPSASICCCSVVQSCPQSRPITTLGLLVVAVHCCVQIFATPWIAARQASLSITNSRSLAPLIHKGWAAAHDSCPQEMFCGGYCKINSKHKRPQLPQVYFPHTHKGKKPQQTPFPRLGQDVQQL